MHNPSPSLLIAATACLSMPCCTYDNYHEKFCWWNITNISPDVIINMEGLSASLFKMFADKVQLNFPLCIFLL